MSLSLADDVKQGHTRTHIDFGGNLELGSVGDRERTREKKGERERGTDTDDRRQTRKTISSFFITTSGKRTEKRRI